MFESDLTTNCKVLVADLLEDPLALNYGSNIIFRVLATGYSGDSAPSPDSPAVVLALPPSRPI